MKRETFNRENVEFLLQLCNEVRRREGRNGFTKSTTMGNLASIRNYASAVDFPKGWNTILDNQGGNAFVMKMLCSLCVNTTPVQVTIG